MVVRPREENLPNLAALVGRVDDAERRLRTELSLGLRELIEKERLGGSRSTTPGSSRCGGEPASR
jgi:hypothetical protein